MEERAHPKYIIGTYERNGNIKTYATAYDKENLERKLIELLKEGDINPEELVILRPMEGVIIKLEPNIEFTFDEA